MTNPDPTASCTSVICRDCGRIDLDVITLPTLSAALLVAGHVHNLWGQWSEPDMRGCCYQCCGPCAALKTLLDNGQLDILYGIYVGVMGGEHEPWDPEKRQVGRKWLTEAWSVDLGCHQPR